MSTELSTNTAPARGLALATFDDAFRFAKMVASSEFAPKDFRGKPESCLLAIQHGSEIGLSPMQSLQNIACINGRPAIWGDAALAIVQASAVCEFVFEEITGEGEQMAAVCQAKRRGYTKPTVATFTVADAKRAGLWGKSGPWTQYPKRMLQLRARGFALRDAFPDVLKGLVTAEEAQDYPTPAATVEPVAAPASKAEPAKATAEDLQRSRLAVNKAKNLVTLEGMRDKVEARLGEGFYTPAQADELFSLINGRIDIVTSTPDDNGQEFNHEAAESEVHA